MRIGNSKRANALKRDGDKRSRFQLDQYVYFGLCPGSNLLLLKTCYSSRFFGYFRIFPIFSEIDLYLLLTKLNKFAKSLIKFMKKAFANRCFL
jgi:hypothetical protein